MTIATAPGKIILVGEHAVVYGQPAIAVPVWELVATATIAALPPGRGCTIVARDLDLTLQLATAAADEPLALVTRLTLATLGAPPDPDWQIELSSQIPIASGLGSGAALSSALVKAIYAHVGQAVTPAQVSNLVYASEQLYHGTPSGIDNTVIAYGLPLWFVKGETSVAFTPGAPFTIVIADSGIRAPTKETVGDVRQGWQREPQRYEKWFTQIGEVVTAARHALATGDQHQLGNLFTRNQQLLEALGVSSPRLAELIGAANAAGALGAKLSGGGRGGNVIALVTPEQRGAVTAAFHAAGAQRVVVTVISGQGTN